MKYILSVYALVLWACIAFADNIPLTISGGGAKIVQVDRVIVVKVDVTLVSSFPFQVKAPPNAALYFWQFPATVTASDQGDTLEISAAPKGELTIGVKIVDADWDNKKFITKFGRVTFSVGEIGPTPPEPKPPDPKPPEPGRLGLIKVSRDGAALVVDKLYQKALATSNRTLASKIAAGGVTEPTAILDEWRATNRTAVGIQIDIWKPWADAVSPALAALHKSGKLASKTDWSDAFLEIAKGLEP